MVQNLYSLPTTTTNVTVVSSMHQVLSALFTFSLNRRTQTISVYMTLTMLSYRIIFPASANQNHVGIRRNSLLFKPSYCRFVNDINEIDAALAKVLYKMEKQKICLTGCYYVVWSYCLKHTRQFWFCLVSKCLTSWITSGMQNKYTDKFSAKYCNGIHLETNPEPIKQ